MNGNDNEVCLSAHSESQSRNDSFRGKTFAYKNENVGRRPAQEASYSFYRFLICIIFFIQEFSFLIG